MATPTTTSDKAGVLETERPAAAKGSVPGVLTWADERLGLGKIGRASLRKVFPDHWSFLLGEIALYSFLILLITGIFLTLWFKPSMAEIEYDGSYQLLKGIPVSEAFASTLDISFDIRGGLLVRQIHHWAALLFVAAAFVHMLRIFFTGAFRKPREVNWIIGVGLMAMGLMAGFAGYSLPDDLLSGTGLRFVDGLIRSIPIVGTWAEFFVFGGEFPGELIISRLYMAHILLIPGLLLGLVSAHLALVVYHKHSQYPGPGHSENNVVGFPLFPVYMAKAGGFFFIVFGFLTLMGGLFQINPVWLYGPYDPAKVTAGSQPDWYMGWVEGGIRIMPGWESHIGGTTWSWNIFLPGVGLMTLLFVGLALWPFLERWLTGDNREHHILDRPRNAPTRTAIGVAGITVFSLFMLGGGNDILATRFHLSLNAVTEFLRVAVFVLPVIAFIITRRLCLSLQRQDKQRVLHGSETGVIVRSPEGHYSEAHTPISQEEAYTLTQHVQRAPLTEDPATDANGFAASRQVGGIRARASRWFLGAQVAKPTAAEIDAAEHHDDDEDHAVTGGGASELNG
ncbi:MAG: cytochrome b [Arachnia sp.]